MSWATHVSRASVIAALFVVRTAMAQQPTTQPERRAPVATADAARAIDAELRAALYELLAERPIAALTRLRVVERRAASRTALDGARDGARLTLALQVLMMQCYARLGLDDHFERAATALLGDPTASRLAPSLRARLAIAAYARRDDARVVDLTRGARGDADAGGLLPLVYGLAQYRLGALREARAGFAEVRRGGGAYTSHAAYADAVAAARADTVNPRAALDSLMALATRETGAVADQARVTAAQLSYQFAQYDDAVALARGVGPRGPASADALLIEAWSLYRAGAFDRAATAFDDYASRFADRSAHGEARVMAGQSLLLIGRTDEAARRLRAAADTAALDAALVERALPATMATDIVARRDERQLLIRSDDGSLLVPDGSSGLDAATLTAVVNGTALPRPAVPRLSAVAAIASPPRNAPATSYVERLLHVTTDGSQSPAVRAGLAAAAARLTSADAAARVARLALEHQTAAATPGAAIDDVRRRLSAERMGLDSVARALSVVDDSLARLAASATVIARGRRSPRSRTADSVAARPWDARVRAVVNAERDSATQQLALARALATRVRARVAEVEEAVGAPSRPASDDPAVRQARTALDAAERERAGAEADLVVLVQRELDARRLGLVAMLRRENEAAAYAAAGAAFFVATRGDAPRPVQVVRPRTRRAAPAAARP